MILGLQEYIAVYIVANFNDVHYDCRFIRCIMVNGVKTHLAIVNHTHNYVLNFEKVEGAFCIGLAFFFNALCKFGHKDILKTITASSLRVGQLKEDGE